MRFSQITMQIRNLLLIGIHVQRTATRRYLTIVPHNSSVRTLDDKRAPTDENDIPDIIERFRSLDKEAARARTERSFLVPKEEIAANNYDLTVNKYKKVEYAPVEYPPTEQIIAELHELEMEITAGLAELEEML